MKNIFRKTKIVLALIFVLMVGFVSGNLAFNGNQVNADDVSIQTSYYSLTYADNELKIMLNPALTAYTDFSKSDISELKTALIDVIKSIVLDDIVFTDSNTGKERVRNNLLLSHNVRRLSLPGVDVDLIKSILDNQLTDVETINNDLLSGNTYDLMLQFYVDRYVDSYIQDNPGTTEQEVIEDIKETLVTAVTEKVSDTYTIAGYDDSSSINQEAVAATEEKINELLGAVSEMKENGESVELTISDVVDIINTIEVTEDIVDYVKTIDAKTEINNIITNSTVEEITSFFTDVDPNTIVTIVKEAEVLDKDDVTEIISNVGVDNFITIVESLSVDNLKDLADAVDISRDELTEIISDHIDEISISDILKVFKSLTVNNHEIYNNGLNTSGIKAVLKELPRFSDIASWSDDEMKYSFDVVVGTSFGDVSFKLTIGFDGDCSRIRRLASFLADHIAFYNDNGTYTLELLAPEKTASIINRVLESSYIDDDLRARIFNLFDASVDELYEKFMESSLDDYIDLLEKVDYKALLQKLLDADNWNSLLKTDKFTNARIDKVIDFALKVVRKLENYSYADVLEILGAYIDTSKLENEKVERLFNFVIRGLNKIDNGELSAAKLREFAYSDTSSNESVYSRLEKVREYTEYFDKLKTYVTKVYNKIPQKYREMNLVQFYEEDSTLNIGGNINIDAAIDLLPQRIQDGLGVILDKLPSNISLRVIVTIPHIYKIEYRAGSETKVGFLPVGATIDKYHGFTEINGCQINKWVDGDGNEVVTMPEGNIALYAVTEFFVTASADVNKVYDGNEELIYVEVEPEGDYTYQWFKDGVAIDGATSASYAVKDVNDSGEYKCEVTSPNSFNESSVINVQITKAKVNVSGYAWTNDTTFVYDGSEKEVKLASAIDEKLEVVYTNNAKTNAGDYEASVAFSVKAEYANNYEVEGEVAKLAWKIEKAIINVGGFVWSNDTTFVYDGSEKEVKLASVIDEKLEVAYTNNAKTNAGDYEASVAFSVKAEYANNYEVEGEVAKLAWKIEKAKVNVSGYTWKTPVDSYYDNQVHKMQLVSYDEKLVPTYAGNEATIVGNYEASVTFAVKAEYANNYEVEGEVAKLAWKIMKGYLDVSLYKWNVTDGKYEYTGNAIKVELVAFDERLDVNYTDNEKTNAGTYKAKVTFTVKDAYKALFEISGSVVDLDWEITKAKVDVSGYKWNTANKFTYDGAAHTLELADAVDEKLEVTYTNNSQTNAGNYNVSVSYALKDAYKANYEIVGSTQDSTLTIEKAKIDVSAYKWASQTTFKYDGSVKEVKLASAIDEKIDAHYTNNQKSEAGEYVATVTFTLKADYAGNYEIVGSIDNLSWKIEKDQTPPTPSKVKDFPAYSNNMGGSYVKVDALNGIDADTNLSIVEREVGTGIDINSVLAYGERGKVFAAYDIHFEKAGEEVDVNDTFTIRMLIPTELRNKANIAVIHIADDGTVELVDFTRDGKFVVFTVSSFSVYAIMEVKAAPNWFVCVLIGLLLAGLIVLIVFILLKRKEEEDEKTKTFFVKITLCDKEVRNYYYELKDFIKAYSNKIECVIEGLKEEFKVDEKTEVAFTVNGGELYVRVYDDKTSKGYRICDDISVIRVKAILKKKFDAIDFSKVKSLNKQNRAKYKKEVVAPAPVVAQIVEAEKPVEEEKIETTDAKAKTNLKITKKFKAKKK